MSGSIPSERPDRRSLNQVTSVCTLQVHRRNGQLRPYTGLVATGHARLIALLSHGADMNDWRLLCGTHLALTITLLTPVNVL